MFPKKSSNVKFIASTRYLAKNHETYVKISAKNIPVVNMSFIEPSVWFLLGNLDSSRS